MTTRKLNRLTGLTLGLLLAAPAIAIEPPAASYRAELGRCLTLIKGGLQDEQTTRLRHTITDIEKRGAWYEFDIDSEIFHSADSAAVRETSTRCRVNRFDGTTEVSG